MQLELLGHRNPQNHNQANPRAGDQSQILDHNGAPADQRTIAEFLDNLISNQGQNLASLVNPDVVESDDLSGVTVGASPTVRDNQAGPVVPNEGQDTVPEDLTPDSAGELPVVRMASVLPDAVEEPPPELAHNQPETEPAFDNPALLEPLPLPTSSQPHNSSRHDGPHRVTILSSHPLDSLASRLASVITGVMFIPLDSLYLRSLASSHLSRTGSPALSDVRALSIFPHGRSISCTLSYLGKLGLTFGIQTAVSASVWGVITGVAIRIGKSFCGWGKL